MPSSGTSDGARTGSSERGDALAPACRGRYAGGAAQGASRVVADAAGVRTGDGP